MSAAQQAQPGRDHDGDLWQIEIAAGWFNGSGRAARTSLGDSGAWYGPRLPALGAPAAAGGGT